MATGRRSSSFSPSSLPPQLEKGPGVEREDSWKNEMNSFVGGRAMSEADAEWMEDDQILLLREQQRDALKKREESYGSLRDGLPEEDPVPLRERLSQNRSRRKRKRRYGHRLESNPFMSLKRVRLVCKLFPLCLLLILQKEDKHSRLYMYIDTCG